MEGAVRQTNTVVKPCPAPLPYRAQSRQCNGKNLAVFFSHHRFDAFMSAVVSRRVGFHDCGPNGDGYRLDGAAV